MRASQIAPPKIRTRGTIISFCESTLDDQRAYVWNYISQQTCLYVDWSGDISRHNCPPPMPHTLLIHEQAHTQMLNIITLMCSFLDVHILVFDPFTSTQNQHVAPLFCAIRHIVRTNDITVFFMLAAMQAPLIQAEVYIDPRR